ncbi:MAG: outer membrane beta-barrel protein [Candidatus Tectomicrobia bacterium]|nr:outer membrane beta-barrel protein [Candidatus Tectomicrobia bacterium]
MVVLVGSRASRAGEVNILAFGGLYDALGAEASISDSPPSREAGKASFGTGEIYGIRIEGYSTRDFSRFFGFGLGVAYFERDFRLKSGDSNFRTADVKSEAIEITLSALFRRPSGQIRPYAGTGLSILILEENVKDKRNEAEGATVDRFSIQTNDVGWHFLGGLKWFLPDELFPKGFPGRFFVLGEYRYLVSNIVADGKGRFSSLKDQLNGQFFVGGFGYQF